MGTLRSVSANVLAIEVRDVARGATRVERVLVGEDTRYREGKTTVANPAEYVGGRAVASVEWEDGPSGGKIYRATEVRLTKPKS